LEDIAEVFGDDIILEDVSAEAIHRRFKDSHYKEEVLADFVGNEEKRVEVVEVEGHKAYQRLKEEG
jgi:hypothetical protein